jgi:hypothetical protein
MDVHHLEIHAALGTGKALAFLHLVFIQIDQSTAVGALRHRSLPPPEVLWGII